MKKFLLENLGGTIFVSILVVYIWSEEILGILTWVAIYILIPAVILALLYAWMRFEKYRSIKEDQIRLHEEQIRIKKEQEQEQIRIKKEQEQKQIRIKKEQEQNERERLLHRDAEQQDEPYIYTIGRHAQEALAIRYGIANPSNSIKLRKLKKLQVLLNHLYL